MNSPRWLPSTGRRSASDEYEEKRLRKLTGEAELARKAIDKPNLHRLLELSDVFLTDFQHGDVLYEMAFEATHQPLKRSIERGNWQRPHLAAM